MKQPLEAGFARTDITPDPGVRLGGYGVEKRPAEAIADPLHATALVLARGRETAALVNLDWICVEESTVALIRRAIEKKTGIPGPRVTICATHTHSAPNTLNAWGWGNIEQAYIDRAIPEIARAAAGAQAALAPASVGFATTACRAGVNRRAVDAGGGVGGFGADPHGPFDPTLTVVRFRHAAAEAGVIVHYGAHGTAMGNNRVVSRDWCGVMKDRIESQFPGPVLFLNGALGDVGPRMSLVREGRLRAGAGDGLHAVREVGYRAAADAIGALAAIREWRTGLPLRLATADIFLPYAPLTPLDTARAELARWAPHRDEWGKPMCEYRHHQAVIEAHGKPRLDGRLFRQTLTGLGPLALVPMPGEMFSGIALRLRAASPFRYTLCCSVSNGSLSYLPTREARHRGGYETWQGRAAGPYLLADNIDDALVAENLRLLKQLAGASP